MLPVCSMNLYYLSPLQAETVISVVCCLHVVRASCLDTPMRQTEKWKKKLILFFQIGSHAAQTDFELIRLGCP